MERPDKKYLTKPEFEAVYPEVFSWIQSYPTIESPDGSGNWRVVNGKLKFERYHGKELPCWDCGAVHFINNKNLYHDFCRDGKIRCRACSGVVSRKKVDKERLTAIGLYAASFAGKGRPKKSDGSQYWDYEYIPMEK